MRLNLQSTGGMDMTTAVTQQLIQQELCNTRKAAEKNAELLAEVLVELKGIRAAVEVSNAKVAEGIKKADESLAEARLMRDELATTKTHIAEAKAAVEADTLSRRSK